MTQCQKNFINSKEYFKIENPKYDGYGCTCKCQIRNDKMSVLLDEPNVSDTKLKFPMKDFCNGCVYNDTNPSTLPQLILLLVSIVSIMLSCVSISAIFF